MRPLFRRPALFDLQVNGFGGVDYQQAGLSRPALRASVEALRRHSIHRILLTLITDDLEAMCRQVERVEAFCAADPLIAATIAGYHLEGPYLSPVAGYSGAHAPARMRAPAVAELERFIAAARGRLRLVTLAPECPGSEEFIVAARHRSVLISLGHTNASEAEIDGAIRAGATLCTHLGNAVPAALSRHDNIMQRLLARDELTACFIPDGLHLPPFVLKNFFRAKPPGKVVLTTDCMAAAGAPPGNYSLGSLQVAVAADGIVRERGKSNFAGSALTLDRGVEQAAQWLGLSRADAWDLASTAVAELFQLTLPEIEVVG